MHIGILEDDPLLRGMLSELLELHGHTTSPYSTSFSFLRAATKSSSLQQRPFDLVLIDLLLPGNLFGTQVLRYLQTKLPGFSIIIISGLEDDILDGIQRNFPDVNILSKPFRIQELLDLIQKETSIRQQSQKMHRTLT